MGTDRPFVMSLAGLDPSAGAGLLADIKTFEQHQVYGLGVCTALTVQTESRFISAEWTPLNQVIAQAAPLLESYPVIYCKIGIVRDVDTLTVLATRLHKIRPGIKIVLDPVLKATAGFTVHNSIQWPAWQQLLSLLYLVTPNYEEAMQLTGCSSGEEAAMLMAKHCHVLLKGGHRPTMKGQDTLYMPDAQQITAQQGTLPPKHGSGCILSAAITAGLAKGDHLLQACTNAKAYTEKILASHHSLLGYHT